MFITNQKFTSVTQILFRVGMRYFIITHVVNIYEALTVILFENA